MHVRRFFFADHQYFARCKKPNKSRIGARVFYSGGALACILHHIIVDISYARVLCIDHKFPRIRFPIPPAPSQNRGKDASLLARYDERAFENGALQRRRTFALYQKPPNRRQGTEAMVRLQAIQISTIDKRPFIGCKDHTHSSSHKWVVIENAQQPTTA